jgi:membrane protein involved in colicin uptake
MSRVSVLLSTIVCAVVLFAACSEPPKKEIDQAQQAIDNARQAGAEQYAPEEFAAATSALQQAREAVDQRDYRLALSRAVDASDRAQEAARAAAENKAKARSQAEAAINTTNASVMHLQARLKVADEVRVPSRELSPARATLKEAEGTLQKARALLSAGNYAGATAAVAALDGQIRSEIRVVEAAITLRTARRPPRKR